MTKYMKLLSFLFILFFSLSSIGSEHQPELFDQFWQNAAGSFQKEKAHFHLAAIGLTPLMIETGVDAKVHNHFEENPTNAYIPGDIYGAVAPLLLISPLYIYGRSESDSETLGAAYALTQTTIITLSYISLLKAFTGRPPPDNESSLSTQEQSEKFRFGLSRRGIVWGWPSGHMGVTTALAATLTNYYPENLWVKISAAGTAGYMLLTISANDKGQMHWFSDGVAGALMGYAIGSTVGSNFRSRRIKQKNSEENYTVLPLFAPNRSGIQIVWSM